MKENPTQRNYRLPTERVKRTTPPAKSSKKRKVGHRFEAWLRDFRAILPRVLDHIKFIVVVVLIFIIFVVGCWTIVSSLTADELRSPVPPDGCVCNKGPRLLGKARPPQQRPSCSSYTFQ